MTMTGEALPPTRHAAMAAGASKYWTGRPCKHGHIAPRWTAKGNCTTCHGLILAARKFVGPPKPNRGRDRDNARRLSREHYARNRDEYIKRAANWVTENRARRREIANQWVRDNPRKALAAVRKRQASKLQRTPIWANLDAIAAIYANCPSGYQVDHIIPLRGKLVSGLHVHNNLQYLPKHDNMLKGNKFNPDTFNHD